MWEIFDHLKFLKHIFNFADVKVQGCGVLSAGLGILANWAALVTGCYTYLVTNVLGVSVFLITCLFVIMVVDYITGLTAAHQERQKIISKKGLRWVFKLGFYILTLVTLNGFVKEAFYQGQEWLIYPLNLIKLYAMFHICLWEIKSIGENLHRLGYGNYISDLMEWVGTAIRELFSRKVTKNE